MPSTTSDYETTPQVERPHVFFGSFFLPSASFRVRFSQHLVSLQWSGLAVAVSTALKQFRCLAKFGHHTYNRTTKKTHWIIIESAGYVSLSRITCAHQPKKVPQMGHHAMTLYENRNWAPGGLVASFISFM